MGLVPVLTPGSPVSERHVSSSSEIYMECSLRNVYSPFASSHAHLSVVKVMKIRRLF